MGILEEVIKEIKPNQAEEAEVNLKIKNFLNKIKIKNAKVVLGGSGAKGTWLREAHDADVFVLFNYNKYKDKNGKISDILSNELKKKFGKAARLHGSRDYFQIVQSGFTFEIVPILEVKKAKDALNITDVSPLHSGWVIKNTDKKSRDDVRLAKMFCKANNVYGAESHIKGFSGYVLEILTVHYGSFMRLVKAAAKWKEKEIIDVKKYYKNKNQLMHDLNKAKTQSPLILIDPVQAERNAAAALSIEKYNKFIDACKRFVKKPNIEFFKIKKITLDELKKKAGSRKLVALNVTALPGKEDIVGSMLLKALDFIKKELENYGFDVKECSWHWEKGGSALFWFYVQKADLDKQVINEGPPVKLEKHAENFKKMHKNTFVKSGKIYAKDERKFVNAEKCVKFLINNRYVKERVKKIEFQT